MTTYSCVAGAAFRAFMTSRMSVIFTEVHYLMYYSTLSNVHKVHFISMPSIKTKKYSRSEFFEMPFQSHVSYSSCSHIFEYVHCHHLTLFTPIQNAGCAITGLHYILCSILYSILIQNTRNKLYCSRIMLILSYSKITNVFLQYSPYVLCTSKVVHCSVHCTVYL